MNNEQEYVILTFLMPLFKFKNINFTGFNLKTI